MLKKSIILFVLSLAYVGSVSAQSQCRSLFFRGEQTFFQQVVVERLPFASPEIHKEFRQLGQTLSDALALLNAREMSYRPAGELKEIPIDFAVGGNLDPAITAKLPHRLAELPVELSGTILEVWNHMLNPRAFRDHMEQLSRDTIAETLTRNIPREVQALKDGSLSRNAMLRVLLRRSRDRGEGAFQVLLPRSQQHPITERVKSSTDEGFRAAVAQGPFFDKPFMDYSRTKKLLDPDSHGGDTHFLQRDFVFAVLARSMRNPQEFWDYLGSKKGIGFWVLLFDNSLDQPGRVGAWSSPEYVKRSMARFPLH